MLEWIVRFLDARPSELTADQVVVFFTLVLFFGCLTWIGTRKRT